MVDPTPNAMGCPAPAGLSGSPPRGREAADAKLLRMGPSSLLVAIVSGACSPMLPSLPSRGMLLAKPLFADACTQLISLHSGLPEACMSVAARFRESPLQSIRDAQSLHCSWHGC